MREFELTDAPHGPPWGCVHCTSAQGPLADTYAQNALGRMYVCKSCARRLNRVFGFTPGKRLEQLSASLETVEALEAELARKEKDNLVLVQAVKGLEIELEIAHAEVQALKDRETTRRAVDAQLAALVSNQTPAA